MGFTSGSLAVRCAGPRKQKGSVEALGRRLTEIEKVLAAFVGSREVWLPQVELELGQRREGRAMPVM